MRLNLSIVFASAVAFSANASALDVTFADSLWDGVSIPKGQQCQKFGGVKPSTPRWIVTGIPAGSSTVVLEYSDRDSEKMDHGGHGRMKFIMATMAEKVEIPSILGHTFEVPSDFKLIEAHRGTGWDVDGAYMPPCSGGEKHAYYVTIKTLKDDTVTAEAVVEMGKY